MGPDVFLKSSDAIFRFRSASFEVVAMRKEKSCRFSMPHSNTALSAHHRNGASYADEYAIYIRPERFLNSHIASYRPGMHNTLLGVISAALYEEAVFLVFFFFLTRLSLYSFTLS